MAVTLTVGPQWVGRNVARAVLFLADAFRDDTAMTPPEGPDGWRWAELARARDFAGPLR